MHTWGLPDVILGRGFTELGRAPAAGLQATTAIAGLATAAAVAASVPARCPGAARNPSPDVRGVDRIPDCPTLLVSRAKSFAGRGPAFASLRQHDRPVGGGRTRPSPPHWVYAFTQVGLQALHGRRPGDLRSPRQSQLPHSRFSRVYQEEWAKWAGGRYHGHPTAATIERVEREYELADLIRVSSALAKESMIRHGIPRVKLFVCPQPVNRFRFAPPSDRRPPIGPLRVCYVGSLDMRKGFIYLLLAARAAGPTSSVGVRRSNRRPRVEGLCSPGSGSAWT